MALCGQKDMRSLRLQIFLTAYLVVFLTGGGRVCACEAFSWIGMDVHAREHRHAHQSWHHGDRLCDQHEGGAKENEADENGDCAQSGPSTHQPLHRCWM